MPTQRANQRALAASRIIENLAYALPPYFDELLDSINHAISLPDHYVGASPPTIDKPTKTLTGRCEADMACPECNPDEPVNCGHQRPCPHHDDPVTLTRAERTANQRDRWRTEYDDAQQVITTITLLANDLLRRARRTVPLTPIEVPRCDATGRDGHLIPRPPHGDGWSNLACTNPRSRGKLCDACATREYRWRTAHGLPPRTDGVFSQAAARAL